MILMHLLHAQLLVEMTLKMNVRVNSEMETMVEDTSTLVGCGPQLKEVKVKKIECRSSTSFFFQTRRNGRCPFAIKYNQFLSLSLLEKCLNFDQNS